MGTSGIRVHIFDALARPVRGCSHAAPIALRTTYEGEASFDATAVAHRLYALIDRALHAAGRRAGDVAAVASSTFWHSLVGVDAGGSPATRVLTWADTTARHAAASLRAELDAAVVHGRTGAPLHASYWPAKLRHLRETEADRYERTSRWLSLGEYVQLDLFGETWSAHGMASATGLYDQRARCWDEPIAAHLGLREGSLPEISDRPLLGLRRSYARRWPALAGVSWLPAIGDGACSNVGNGAVDQRTAAVFLGTSGAVRVLCDADPPAVVTGGWSYRLDERHVVAGGALSNGGNVIDWLSASFPGVDPSALWRGHPRGPALVALPLLFGDRSPTWDDAARGAMAGLSLATTADDIARAMLEGVAHRVARVWGSVAASFPGVQGVVATGGAFVGRPWLLQLVTDAIGRPVIASASPHASARGAAIIALTRIGAIGGLADAPLQRGPVYRPRAEARERLRAGGALQRRLEEALARTGRQAALD